MYSYDDAGNRTSDLIGYGDWTFSTGNIISYGDGNREDSLSYTAYANKDPLTYDFKGNVTDREMLWVDKEFDYGWDAYDRLTTATQTGEDWTIAYKYDALGRMLRREKSGSAGGDNVTFDYWLGLNKLAQEIGGTGAEVVIPDDEVESTPTSNGWYGRSNGPASQTVAYTTDAIRDKVLHIESNSTTDTAKYMIGDYVGDTTNPNDVPLNTGNSVLSLWVKGDGAFNLFAVQATTSAGVRYLYMVTGSGTDYQNGSGFYFYVGSQYRNTTWDYLEVDLAARLDAVSAGETISHIDAVFVYGYDLMIDDIKQAEGRLNRSWAQVPGAALGGYLGAQTGADGANGVAAWCKYYYHFSDLGTVLATTNANGGTLSVDQPDFWGNYRNESYGTRPDTMGLTCKFYDEDSELYYFNARWYDSERARWISNEPVGYDGPNLYHFNYNNTINKVDIDGLASIKGGSKSHQDLVNDALDRACDRLDDKFPDDIPGVDECPSARDALYECLKKGVKIKTN